MGTVGNMFFNNTSNKSADDTLANTFIASTASAAAAYLTATLDSTTPEVRRLFSEYLTQDILSNETLTNLAVTKGWINPYDTLTNQMEASLNQSNSAINNNVQ